MSEQEKGEVYARRFAEYFGDRTLKRLCNLVAERIVVKEAAQFVAGEAVQDLLDVDSDLASEILMPILANSDIWMNDICNALVDGDAEDETREWWCDKLAAVYESKAGMPD